MSEIANKAAAQAHANSEVFYLNQVEEFTNQLVSIRIEVAKFLRDGCCDACKLKLVISDNGIKFVPEESI